jgi:ElaB/YqjD/DUF883 family membrane-anchored ribosome-binding protein
VEQARLDIELTREELGETVQELVHKVNVPARAKEQAEHVAERAKEQAEHAKEQAEHVAGIVREKVPPPVAENAERLAGAVRRNPWAAIGTLVLMLVLLRTIARRRSQ